MALTKCNVPTDTIGSIGTNPEERGLTTQQFKDKFDEMPEGIKAYLNDTLTVELEALLPPETMMQTDEAQIMTAQLTAKTGTDYTTKQVRNIRFKATDDFTAAEIAEGEIGFVYAP